MLDAPIVPVRAGPILLIPTQYDSAPKKGKIENNVSITKAFKISGNENPGINGTPYAENIISSVPIRNRPEQIVMSRQPPPVNVLKGV